jgi:hypothetical protein
MTVANDVIPQVSPHGFVCIFKFKLSEFIPVGAEGLCLAQSLARDSRAQKSGHTQ